MDITVQELRERLEKGEKLNLIDVREPNEYADDNIGGTLIPLGELPHRIDDLDGMQDEEVIVHCRSGARSARAQQFLEENGFINVRNLVGGMLAYRA
jgi:rhodanese-related sulfurtransferase